MEGCGNSQQASSPKQRSSSPSVASVSQLTEQGRSSSRSLRKASLTQQPLASSHGLLVQQVQADVVEDLSYTTCSRSGKTEHSAQPAATKLAGIKDCKVDPVGWVLESSLRTTNGVGTEEKAAVCNTSSKPEQSSLAASAETAAIAAGNVSNSLSQAAAPPAAVERPETADRCSNFGSETLEFSFGKQELAGTFSAAVGPESSKTEHAHKQSKTEELAHLFATVNAAPPSQNRVTCAGFACYSSTNGIEGLDPSHGKDGDAQVLVSCTSQRIPEHAQGAGISNHNISSKFEVLDPHQCEDGAVQMLDFTPSQQASLSNSTQGLDIYRA